MKLKNRTEQQEQEIRIKNRMIFILLMIIAFSLYKFASYPKQLTVHTAPDISKSFVQKVGDVPNHSVYGFARTLWETINYCEENCATEYPEQLDKYQVFLTKECYQELKSHFNRNTALYQGRARRFLPTDESAFDVKRVKKVSSNMWYVYLQYLLDDDVGGLTTRKQIMEYSMKITSSSVPTNYNPWGLSIDCFWDAPKVKEYKELKEIK